MAMRHQSPTRSWPASQLSWPPEATAAPPETGFARLGVELAQPHHDAVEREQLGAGAAQHLRAALHDGFHLVMHGDGGLGLQQRRKILQQPTRLLHGLGALALAGPDPGQIGHHHRAHPGVAAGDEGSASDELLDLFAGEAARALQRALTAQSPAFAEGFADRFLVRDAALLVCQIARQVDGFGEAGNDVLQLFEDARGLFIARGRGPFGKGLVEQSTDAVPRVGEQLGLRSGQPHQRHDHRLQHVAGLLARRGHGSVAPQQLVQPLGVQLGELLRKLHVRADKGPLAAPAPMAGCARHAGELLRELLRHSALADAEGLRVVMSRGLGSGRGFLHEGLRALLLLGGVFVVVDLARCDDAGGGEVAVDQRVAGAQRRGGTALEELEEHDLHARLHLQARGGLPEGLRHVLGGHAPGEPALGLLLVRIGFRVDDGQPPQQITVQRIRVIGDRADEVLHGAFQLLLLVGLQLQLEFAARVLLLLFRGWRAAVEVLEEGLDEALAAQAQHAHEVDAVLRRLVLQALRVGPVEEHIIGRAQGPFDGAFQLVTETRRDAFTQLVEIGFRFVCAHVRANTGQ